MDCNYISDIYPLYTLKSVVLLLSVGLILMFILSLIYEALT